MTGRTIEQHELVEKLGGGGMGVIYQTRDTHLDRFVAINVLPLGAGGRAVVLATVR